MAVKLRLGNAFMEAPASSHAKLELRVDYSLFVTLRDGDGACRGTVEFYSLPGELFSSPSFHAAALPVPRLLYLTRWD